MNEVPIAAEVTANRLPLSARRIFTRLAEHGEVPSEMLDAGAGGRVWAYTCPTSGSDALIYHYEEEYPNSYSEIHCDACKFDGKDPHQALSLSADDLFDHSANVRSAMQFWGPAEPFTKGASTLPIDGLPKVLKDLVTTVADVIQTPVEIPLTHALGLLSSATFGTVECFCAEGFVVPLNMATVVLADSSARKSPAAKFVLTPFQEINERRMLMDKETQRSHAGAIEAQKARRDAAMAATKTKSKAKDGETNPEWASAGVGGSADPYEVLAQEEAKLEELKEHQQGWAALLGDTTPEALQIKLAHTFTGAALQTADEMDLFDKIKGHSATGTEKANVYLDSLSGNPHPFNRVGRGDGYIPQTALSLALMSQPALFMAHINATPALVDGGLVARMLIVTPPSLAGSRSGDIKPMPKAVTAAWAEAVFAIATKAELHVADELNRRAELAENGQHLATTRIPRRQIKLTEVGLKMFIAYRDKVEAWQRSGARYDEIRGWAGKSDSHLIAAAANLTLLDDPDAVYVDEKYIAYCERLIDAYGEHMLAIAGVESENNAERLWRKLETLPAKGIDTKFDATNYEEDGSISLRALRRLVQNQAWQKNLPPKQKSERLLEALETLAARRYIHIREADRGRMFITIRPANLR
ncbi:DUF3987 domain-containing protein [Prescottella agglutinans]|uniref:DUF3987 domain-containing protein n=1 Tax=Prescottella agglutinans TaxID=1644129 RepID=A0ABT6M4X9_9NOCA|nr:DUF3987 domain-containing protein [Prescottella agglutinans]MDH6279368.1 hypothetical protein [Prescottella agglutinans]